MKSEIFYAIYFPYGGDMQYCRIVYDINEEHKLILNGYSLMADWHDATLFKTKEEALNIILNNIDIPHIQKDKLQIVKIKIEKILVYGTN